MGQRLDDAEDTRSMILSNHLLRHGHEVVLWTNAWDHVRKQWRGEWLNSRDRPVRTPEGLEIRFMKGCGYKSNISVFRLIDHWLAALDFSRHAKQMSRPDVIVASCPDHVTAAAAVRYGNTVGATTIIDVCDKWPDVFFDLLRDSPVKLKLSRILLYYESRRIATALRDCDAIVAMMDSMLEWGLCKAGRLRQETDKVFYLTTSRKNVGANDHISSVSNSVRTALASLKDKLIFSFVGTFNNTQHPSILLDAIDLLERDSLYDSSRIAFLIGGAGVGEKQFAIRAAAKPNVTYLGWLHSDEIAALLGVSDVGLLLLTKPTEAFNHKAFSYLASSLPIINSATGDLANIISDYGIGFNIKAGDPSALAAVICECIRSEDKIRSMKSRVCHLFDMKFERESNYEAYVHHLERLVANGKAIEV